MSSELIAAAHSSVIGGSTAERRIMCPASLTLESHATRLDDNNEYAAEGTALHSAMEHLFDKSNSFVPTNIEAVELLDGVEFNGIVITNELLNEKVMPALDAFAEAVEAYDIVEYLIEVKCGLPSIPGAFGTVDILGITANGDIVVIDWKFGDGRYIDVVGNSQLAFYTACALETDIKEVCDMLDAIEDPSGRVITGIIQPRRGRDEEVARYWETDYDYIYDFIDKCEKAIETAKQPDPPARTGGHCWKCKGELTCPAKRTQIADVTPIKPDLMTAVEISALLDRADEIEGFIKSVRTFAHKQAEKGVAIPGYKLVDKRGSRVYTDKETAEKRLIRELRKAGAYTSTLLTPPQAEKALGKKRYEKLIAPCVSVVSSGTTLAKESDKRPEVKDTDKLLKTIEDAGKKKLPSMFDS